MVGTEGSLEVSRGAWGGTRTGYTLAIKTSRPLEGPQQQQPSAQVGTPVEGGHHEGGDCRVEVGGGGRAMKGALGSLGHEVMLQYVHITPLHESQCAKPL